MIDQAPAVSLLLGCSAVLALTEIARGQDPEALPLPPEATSLVSDDLGAWRDAGAWVVENGVLRAPDGQPLASRESFANYQLHARLRLEPGAAARLLLEGRYALTIDGDSFPRGPKPEWHVVDVRFRHDRHATPVIRAWLDGRPLPEDAIDDRGDPDERATAGPEALPGLRHVWSPAETPDFSDGDFAVVARFRSRGDGTLVAKAPPRGKWAPHGKTLFLRGGHLVYDIGWVGALRSDRRFDDNEWHTAAICHDGSTAFLVVDGEVVGQHEDFASEDAAGHVLKIGATSPNFGGALRRGEVERVAVYDEPILPAVGLRLTRGGDAGMEPVLQWDSEVPSNAPVSDDGDAGVLGAIVLEAEGDNVGFRDVWIRPLSAVDHAGIIRGWDESSIERGRKLYVGMCATCHGADGEKVVHPLARAFSAAKLQNGSDPYRLFRTLTDGFRTMPPQTWMTPKQRYDVVHYLREAFLRERNPSQYFAVDEEWIASLPVVLGSEADSTSVAAGGDELPARDFGPTLGSQIGGRVPVGLTLNLPCSVALGYDLHTMRGVGAWRTFLDLSDTHHYEQRGEGIARPGDEQLPGLDVWCWAFDGSFDRPRGKPPRGPVPAPRMRWRGRYVHGRDVVLSYEIQGRELLEWPTAVRPGEHIALVHTLRVGAGDASLRLAVAQRPDTRVGGRPSPVLVMAGDGPQPAVGRIALTGDVEDAEAVGRFAAAAIRGDADGLTWEVDADGRVVLTIAPSDKPRTFAVLRSYGAGRGDLDGFVQWIARNADDSVVDLSEKTRPGPRLWPKPVITRGVLGKSGGAYELDTLPLPIDNTHGAWLRTSAIACFENGDVAVVTLGGDVWTASFDDDLAEIRWNRFATGLFEPLGLLVAKSPAGEENVYVTCRDGLTRLHDRNRDGEADYYECFFADPDVTASFHAFNFDLQRDTEGNFYYVKSGRYTDFSLPGAVVAIPPEGGQHRFFATGFRTPNGMGILPDNSLLVSDNQGNWVPASKVSRIREGGFYGVFRTARQERDDFERPVVWLPQEVDSSSGGQLWVDDERFGPLAGHLLHTSFGKGWMYLLTLQEIGDATQASSVTLPFQFAAGVQRARVNPRDGQVYAVGLSGWQGPSGGADGCLQRLRYTGRPETRLLGAVTTPDGVALQFSGPIADESVRPEHFEAERWNYRWTAKYGSAHFSVSAPERRGEDHVEIASAKRSSDQTSILLTLADHRPVDQLRIACDVVAADGTPVRDTVYMTLHVIPER